MDNSFDIYPEQAEDLINFAQFTKVLEIPTAQGGLMVNFSLLWEGEVAHIQRKSAEYASTPQDIMSRSAYIKLETLVQAIDNIGEMQFKADDPNENTLLKNKLRTILQKTSPALVQYMYNCYSELALYRDAFVAEKTADFKKKFQEELQGKSLTI